VSAAAVANLAGGVVALGLLIYLVVALLRPEKF
jgi:K+-transporting ATPase KdpF subunit